MLENKRIFVNDIKKIYLFLLNSRLFVFMLANIRVVGIVGQIVIRFCLAYDIKFIIVIHVSNIVFFS